MKPIAVLFCLTTISLLLLLVFKAGERELSSPVPPQVPSDLRIDASVAKVNSWLRQHWKSEELVPAQVADDLTIYRRLSLALHGTIPSLEEIHAFTTDTAPNRVDRWLLKILNDKRFSTYFADRLARVLTGVEEGQFVVFRRDRLRTWLGEQLVNDRPWTETAKDLIAAEGLWTSEPASNFITAASIEDEGLDENLLAGRTVRAFLGQRIDCAQCHDHPFDRWKQDDFEGLAAFFGQARVTAGGVIDREFEDGEPITYEVIDPGMETGRTVEPAVPFHEEWLPGDASRRRQLAAWVTHSENRRFERAIANRVWGLMFGRSWHDPVDDLAHPEDSEGESDLLDVLGSEFRRNDCSLRFLIRLIASSDAFRADSEVPGVDSDLYSRMDMEWALFPLVRLRPEQMIGAMLQASGVRTIDQNSNLLVRLIRFTNENDFLTEYGDATDDELLQQSGTIPQALLRMNGRFTRELTEVSSFSASGQILNHSGGDESIVDNCFLACLTRMPTAEERSYFVELIQNRSVISSEPGDGQQQSSHGKTKNISRKQTIRDLYWTLFNSPGFSWNR